MNSLSAQLLAMAAAKKSKSGKIKKTAKKSYGTSKKCYGIGELDIDAEVGERWYNVWNNILYQIKNNGSGCCTEWLTASKFKAWFDENYFEGGVLTNLLDPVREPNHYSPETSCIAPLALSKLVVRAGYVSRGSMRGVNVRPRNEHIAYAGICWNETLGKLTVHVAPSELEAHLMWAKSHIVRIRGVASTVPNEHTKAMVEKFIAAMEKDIMASKEIEIFRS